MNFRSYWTRGGGLQAVNKSILLDSPVDQAWGSRWNELGNFRAAAGGEISFGGSCTRSPLVAGVDRELA
ncbi:hypothetical protein EUGRSUZ_G00865 [Eucalyptus grandis]|uniref:Uncharacterized protein n=2 Tax=Eucalyptus grandis TaxID=71139 RepID=A0ACC3K133_EUCGR|nr:hypothetical protein EUGRSUZ_G00865 [Eucalyptus grandis]